VALGQGSFSTVWIIIPDIGDVDIAFPDTLAGNKVLSSFLLILFCVVVYWLYAKT
jgi:hypothetical protein